MSLADRTQDSSNLVERVQDRKAIRQLFHAGIKRSCRCQAISLLVVFPVLAETDSK